MKRLNKLWLLMQCLWLRHDLRSHGRDYQGRLLVHCRRCRSWWYVRL